MELFRQLRHFPHLRHSMRAVQALNIPQYNVVESKKNRPQGNVSPIMRARVVEKKMQTLKQSSFKDLTEMQQISCNIRAKTRQLRRSPPKNDRVKTMTVDAANNAIPDFPSSSLRTKQQRQTSFASYNKQDSGSVLSTWQELVAKLQPYGFQSVQDNNNNDSLDIAGLLAVLGLPYQPRASKLQQRLFETFGIKISDDEAQLISQYCLAH